MPTIKGETITAPGGTLPAQLGVGDGAVPPVPPPPEISGEQPPENTDGFENFDAPMGDPEPEQTPDGQPAKKPGRLQERFHELTTGLKESRAEAAELRERLARMEGVLQGRQPAEQPVTEEVPPEYTPEKWHSIQDEQAAELNDRFGKQAEYVKQLVDFRVNQALKEIAPALEGAKGTSQKYEEDRAYKVVSGVRGDMMKAYPFFSDNPDLQLLWGHEAEKAFASKPSVTQGELATWSNNWIKQRASRYAPRPAQKTNFGGIPSRGGNSPARAASPTRNWDDGVTAPAKVAWNTMMREIQGNPS